MKRQKNVVDLVKAAFLVLTVKVIAPTSFLIPWNSLIDNLCIVFSLSVMLVKLTRLTIALSKAIGFAGISMLVLYTCVSIKQYDLMITLVAVCLLIDEDLDEYITLMLKTEVILLCATVALAVFLSLTGKGGLFWHFTGSRLRFNGGFTHPNVLASYISSCMLMFAWKHFHRISSNNWFWMATVMVLCYIMTRSRTGLLLHIAILLLVYFAQQDTPLMTKLIDPVLVLMFPALSLFIYWVQGQFLSGNRAALLIDEIMTGRIKYAAYAFTRSGTSWLPRYLDYVAAGKVSWTQEWNLNTFTFDNLYSFLFVQMGMIWIVVFSAFMFLVRRKANFKIKVFLLMWTIFSMVEVHGLNCFKFFPLLLLSTLLSKKEPTDESIANA